MEPSESSTRALTIEEAVSFAIILQKNEQLTEAHELFRRIIEAAPDHPRALHYAGVLAHQQGRNDEALALIERSLALAPDAATAASCSNRTDGWSLRSPLTGMRSPSIPATPTPTTIWVCCCGRPGARSKRKPRIAKPSA